MRLLHANHFDERISVRQRSRFVGTDDQQRCGGGSEKPHGFFDAGAQIDATPRGYLLRAAAAGYTGLAACCHSTTEGMRRELYAVVDQGGVVVDVIVENALYGEIRANLNVASRYDADAFARQAEGSPASLLSRMTGGVHLHTIRCADEAAFRRIQAALAEAGVLYEPAQPAAPESEP